MSHFLDLESTASDQIRLAIIMDEEVVWPHLGCGDGASEFDPEDVLSYLADAWVSLLLSQSWPIVFEPDQEPRSVTGLLRAAEGRWELYGDKDSEKVENEETLLDEFLYHHDLSQMKYGSALPSCYIIRQQNRIQIETNGRIFDNITFKDFISELLSLATLATTLLQKRSERDSVVARLVARWEGREEIDPITAGARISGVSRADIEGADDLRTIFVNTFSNRQLTEIANDNANPVYAAARSSGILGPRSLAEVLRFIMEIPQGDSTELAKFRRHLCGGIRDINSPREQGIRAAAIVREWLQSQEGDPIDLVFLSNELKIDVRRLEIFDYRLDGIATAGPEHGPAILLNINTRRQGAGGDDLERSLRFTWGHEIGHLLLDEEEWPALIDAVRQCIPRSVETRANAFAAYLLLPPTHAYRQWENDGQLLDWRSVESVLNALTNKFGLPRIAAARQLVRGAPPERQTMLERAFGEFMPNYTR